jgi:hypothetical protein
MLTSHHLPSWMQVSGGGGGVVTGAPNALVYINPLGTAHTTDAGLVAAPVDPFGRPQIRDIRLVGGVGPVYRQGAWESDGDPAPNVQGEGLVIYGTGLGGNQNAGEGGYGRIKKDRLGLVLLTPGVWTAAPPGGGVYYAARIDWSGIKLRPDTLGLNEPDPSFQVDRASGNLMTTGSVRVGGPTGARTLAGVGDPNGVVVGSPGDMYLNQAGGANTTLYVKESGSGTNTGWVGK